MSLKIYSLDLDTMRKIIINIYTVMKINMDYLNSLDAAIGDGEHGISIVRGFEKALESLEKGGIQDVGLLLNIVGMAFLQNVGGATGVIYGMFFLEGSKVVRGKSSIDVNDFITILEAGLNGIIKVGGASVGDKTIVDVLAPVVMKAKDIISSYRDVDFILLLNSLIPFARECLLKTIFMKAKRGRASYLGDRSIGHQDPGATSMYLLLRTFLDTLNGKIGIKVVDYDHSSGAIIREEYIS